MRVISGKKKGKKLETLKGDTVRPTTDKVKESIFNVIQFDLPGCKFLDLFAGSGQMGIEALSRGASETIFVDNNKDSINVIKRNLKAADLCENAEVFHMDAISFLKQQMKSFDVIFLDPPYKKGLLQQALYLSVNAVSENGLIICEHPIDEILPEPIDNFVIQKEYKYGKITISIYRHKDVIEE